MCARHIASSSASQEKRDCRNTIPICSGTHAVRTSTITECLFWRSVAYLGINGSKQRKFTREFRLAECLAFTEKRIHRRGRSPSKLDFRNCRFSWHGRTRYPGELIFRRFSHDPRSGLAEILALPRLLVCSPRCGLSLCGVFLGFGDARFPEVSFLCHAPYLIFRRL